MNFELLHPADQIVMIMDRIYKYGMTTTSGGNLSVRDESGDIWITPGGIDKGSLNRRDIVCVKPDGTLEGIHKPSIELPFHQTVYSRRPDVRAVLHAHPPALIAFSMVGKTPNIRLIPNAKLVCGEVGMAGYSVPGSAELGEKVASVFAQGYKSVVLQNHGVVVAGADLFQAFMAFETLDFCARLEIAANRIGTPAGLPDQDIEESRIKLDVQIKEFGPDCHTTEEKGARRELCELIHRAYGQQLFTSTQGTISRRLQGNRFLITPHMVDRAYMEPEDLVLIDGTSCQAGKTPSRSVLLHRHIYDTQPHVNSIILAHPPTIMAFAVTGQAFDSRTIPESYVMLRDVPMLSFGASFLSPEKTAQLFVPGTPVVLVQNDCVIITGASPINAFDRLEVAEYSAKAIIATKGLGQIVTITDTEISEIDRVFNL